MKQPFLAALLGLCLLAPAHAQEAVSLATTANLVRAAEKSSKDPIGWAEDLLDVLNLNRLPQSRENICSAIAVIDQESSFNANPQVPGLGKISEAALREKMAAYPLIGSRVIAYLESTPSAQDNYMLRIRRAVTERDLDMVYRALVADAASRSNLGILVSSGFFNPFIEERNQISTIGSMQVSVKFSLDVANDRRWLPMSLNDVYAVRDELYTRHGGMYYGVKQLLGYDTGYDKKIYRFADYNAGRYSSRNAAFQKMVSALSGESLVADGDLLAYDKSGSAKSSVSSAERAIRTAVAKHHLALTDKNIRRDLLLEKEQGFATTPTFQWLKRTYANIMGREAPFAAVPEIDLKSPKIRRHMTTAIFAEMVNKRYQACMAKK